METQQTHVSAPGGHAHRIKHARKFIYGYIFLILLAAVAGGMYSWQHKKVDDLNKQLSSTNSQLKNVAAELNAKTKAYNSLNAQLLSLNNASKTPLTQTSLTLSIVSATRYSPDSSPDLVNKGVAVQILLTNNTTSTISVYPNSFNLLDNQSNSYNQSTFDSQTSGYSLNTLPNNGVALNAQTMAPKATLRGTLLFIVSDPSLTKFTLVNGSQTYPVNLSN